MKRHSIILLMSIILSFRAIPAQTKNPLAKFGDKEISQQEFKYRYELSPRAGAAKDIQTQKEQFLYTLISEKLWALEAKSLGFENDEYLKNYLKIIESLYVRDALFKEEIESKVTINQDEINSDLKKIKDQLEINFLFSTSKAEIDSLYKKLNNGVNFELLLAGRTEADEQKETIKIVYGQLESYKENILFNLQPGEFSRPVEENIGWVIYYLKSKMNSPLVAGMDFNKKLKSVKEVIENRKKQILFNEFVKNIYGDENINADKILFQKLYENIKSAVFQKCELSNCNKTEKQILYDSDFRKIKSAFTKEELELSFIKFEENPVNLNYFIDHLAFNEFQIQSVDEELIGRVLNSKIKEFITLELITREGYKRNLNSGEELQNALNLWRDNYLSQLLKNHFIDSAKVSDDEAYQHFVKSKNDSTLTTKINILELLTDSLSVVEDVLNKIAEGADFRELAIKHTIRERVKNNNGEFGLFSVDEYPELGSYASNLKIGEFGGPIELKEGFSIFQIIEKEEMKENFTNSFEEEKDLIKEKIFYEKMDRIIKSKTKEFAKKYNLEVNESLLNQIKTTEINVLIYRHFGFGGRILAAPFLNMFYEWFEEYQKENDKTL